MFYHRVRVFENTSQNPLAQRFPMNVPRTNIKMVANKSPFSSIFYGLKTDKTPAYECAANCELARKSWKNLENFWNCLSLVSTQPFITKPSGDGEKQLMTKKVELRHDIISNWSTQLRMPRTFFTSQNRC